MKMAKNMDEPIKSTWPSMKNAKILDGTAVHP